MNDLVKLRDTFRESADILDDLLVLKEKEKQGQDIVKESEEILGKFLIKMIIIQQLQENL